MLGSLATQGLRVAPTCSRDEAEEEALLRKSDPSASRHVGHMRMHAHCKF